MLSWTLPGAFWLSLSLLPILFFYFLRMRFRAQPVSSVYIWLRLQNLTSGVSKLRRRSVFLLLLQIGAALAAVGAVAQPVLISRHPASTGMVYLIDVSASMNTIESTNGVNRTRLQIAGELLAQELKRLDPKTAAMVFLCGSDAEPLGKTPQYPGRLLMALNRIKISNSGFNESEVANQLQAWLGTQKQPWEGCLISDGGLALGGQALAKVFNGRLKTIIVGKERGNLGIGGLRLTEGKVSFLIHNGFPDNYPVTVGLVAQDRTIARSALMVPPGLSRHTLDPGGALQPGVYKVRLEQHRDALEADDHSLLAVNQQRRFRVLQVGPVNYFLRSALSHPNIELTSLSQFPKELSGYWDLIIADRIRIPAGLKANLLTFDQAPPDAPVRFTGLIDGQIVSTDISHPLLRFVKLEGVQVVGGYKLGVEPGVPVLAEVGGEPIIAAWEEEGWRKIVCGFNLYNSNIGLSGSFPILFQNILQWIMPQGVNELAHNLTVGETVFFGESPSWQIVNDTHFELERNGPLIRIKPLKNGIYQWKSETGEGMMVANLPFEESDLTPRELHFQPKTTTATAKMITDQIPVARWFIIILLGCLFMEWMFWRGAWRLGKERSDVVD